MVSLDLSSLLILTILEFSVTSLLKYLGDPYRTLEPFPVDKYLADYPSSPVPNSKADLKGIGRSRLEADTGRLSGLTGKMAITYRF